MPRHICPSSFTTITRLRIDQEDLTLQDFWQLDRVYTLVGCELVARMNDPATSQFEDEATAQWLIVSVLSIHPNSCERTLARVNVLEALGHSDDADTVKEWMARAPLVVLR